MFTLQIIRIYDMYIYIIIIYKYIIIYILYIVYIYIYTVFLAANSSTYEVLTAQGESIRGCATPMTSVQVRANRSRKLAEIEERDKIQAHGHDAMAWVTWRDDAPQHWNHQPIGQMNARSMNLGAFGWRLWESTPFLIWHGWVFAETSPGLRMTRREHWTIPTKSKNMTILYKLLLLLLLIIIIYCICNIIVNQSR